MKPFPSLKRTSISEISEEAALAEAIDRLPPEQRQAVTMLKLNEMSLKEASAMQRTFDCGAESRHAPGDQELAHHSEEAERTTVTNTPELIETLVESATPVRRLRPPLVRAGLWIMLAALSSG